MRRGAKNGRLWPPLAAATALLILWVHFVVAAPIRVGPDTQLRTIEFDFTNGHSFGDGSLRKVLAEQPVGKHTSLRKAFDWLPFVEPVVPQPFVPLELQKDVARLREFYRRNGFSATEVGYDVRLKEKQDAVDVRFRITEGRPFILQVLDIADSTGADLQPSLPPELQEAWQRFMKEMSRSIGQRIGDKEKLDLETSLLDWFRNHGYPYVRARTELTRDEASFTAALHGRVWSGPRARVEAIRVEGNVPDASQIVRTSLSLGVGDWYSAAKLADGKRALLGREIIRSATTEVPAQPQDSTLEILVRLEKAKDHLLTGEVGYLSDGGVTARGNWTHRRFTGGARTLNVSLVAQSGLWAIEEIPEILVRLSPAWTLPGVLHPRASIVLSPFGEYRDDSDDLSWGYGFNTTLVYYDNRWVRSASLQHTISAKDIIEYRAGSDDLDFFQQVEAALNSVGKHTTLSAFTLSATLGKQDNPVKPRRLLLFRPTIQSTVPAAWNTSEFVRCDLSTSLGRPLGRGVSLWGRVAGGRLFPYGKSVPGADPESRFEKYLELRDDLFNAGGGGDVRGWDSQLLGPKFPDVDSAPDSHLIANRYIPVGGLERISMSAELRFPMPFVGRGWGMHAFTDGGRVWTSDARYSRAEDIYDQERFFFASGLGLDRDSPVGPIRISFAYILNPSPLDVLKPQEFLDLVESGGIGDVHTHWNRRLRVHLAIGAAF